jgi:hypothetical protein
MKIEIWRFGSFDQLNMAIIHEKRKRDTCPKCKMQLVKHSISRELVPNLLKG